MNLILDLGRAGLGTEAVMMGEALGRVDPEQQASFDADVAVALAEAGLAEEARTRVAANLARWPDDFWIRIHAGDALAALGDQEGAEAHFSAAVGMATGPSRPWVHASRTRLTPASAHSIRARMSNSTGTHACRRCQVT